MSEQSPVMRAKLRIESVKQFSTFEELHLIAVTNGSAEDNNFSKYTPSADLKMAITNPDLIGTFKPGKAYYLNFVEAE